MIGIVDYYGFSISAILVMLVSYLLIYKVVEKGTLSLLLVVIKFIFFIAYFTIWCRHNPILLKDDLVYFNQSLSVFEKGKDFGFFISLQGTEYMASLAGGWHFGYFIYNIIAFHLFGPYYFAPVLMNVFFSVVTSVVFYKMLRVARVSKSFSIFAFILFLLHWDIISWSSFINLKDTFVLFLTVFALYSLVVLKEKGFRLINIALFCLILFVFQFIRFYFAYFLLVIAVVYCLLSQMYKIKSKWTDWYMKLAVLFVIPAGFYFVFIHLYSDRLQELGEMSNPLKGILRYLLTPIPFHIDPTYSFISLATSIYWIVMPLTLYGLYLFIKRYFRTLMPLLLLGGLLSVFYGSFAELQGPRHRIPLLCIIVLLQALGLWSLLVELCKMTHISSKKGI